MFGIISVVSIVGHFESRYIALRYPWIPMLLSVISASISTLVWCCGNGHQTFVWKGEKCPSLMGVCQLSDVALLSAAVVSLAVLSKTTEASCVFFFIFFYLSLKWAYNFSWSVIGFAAVNGIPVVLYLVYSKSPLIALFLLANVIMWRQVSTVTEAVRSNERVVRKQFRTLECVDKVISRKDYDLLGNNGAFSIIHELNNALHVVGSNLQFVRDEVDRIRSGRYDHEDMVEALDDSIKKYQHATNLSQEALEVFRGLKQGGAETFWLPEIKKVGIARESTMLPFAGQVDVEQWPEVFVHGTPSKVQSILTNLVKNAVEAGGHIVRIRVELDDGFVVVRVVDLGKGMPRDVFDRLFSKPGITWGKKGGTGLGLWFSRILARSMGGDLSCLWSDSSGTCFELRLKNANNQHKDVDKRTSMG